MPVIFSFNGNIWPHFNWVDKRKEMKVSSKRNKVARDNSCEGWGNCSH